MTITTTLEKVNNGLEKIRGAGGLVSVDGNKGKASIKGVDARFSFDNGVLSVQIIEVPFLVSEEFVEEKIKEFFL